MDFRYAIFDMDGTLLDSMLAWAGLGPALLRRHGLEPPEDLRGMVKSLTAAQAAQQVYVDRFHIAATAREVLAEVDEIMLDFYRTQARLKPGAAEYLEYLAARGVKMCIATSTDAHLARAALAQAGISHHFPRILTSAEVGGNKATSPEIFERAMELLGGSKEDTVIFEDSFYAVRTATNAGFRCVGIADADSLKSREGLRALCERFVHSFMELM